MVKSAEWPARTAWWAMFLASMVFPQAVGTDEDDVLPAVEEVEREDALEGGTVQCGGPIPVPVGERLEAIEAGAFESALDAAAVFVLEFVGDDAFEEDGGAPALARGLGDEVIELIGGAMEPEATDTNVPQEGRIPYAPRPSGPTRPPTPGGLSPLSGLPG